MSKQFLLFVLFLSSSVTSAETITLPSDQELNVEIYGNNLAQHTILWMPSERGITEQLQRTLLDISKTKDIKILLPDWIDSYYITPSRSSYEEIPQKDVEDLIIHYVTLNNQTDDGKLIIAVDSRASGLVLNAAHHLQSKGYDSIAGIILISPYLQKQTPDIGKGVSYQEIVSYSNLPIYLIQTERSPRFVPLKMLLSELEKGGSPIYRQILNDVSGGFHARDSEDLTDNDSKAQADFPNIINNAITLLKQSHASPLKEIKQYTKNIRKNKSLSLQKVSYVSPKLKLTDTKGVLHNLSDYEGKVVLVSFWASWCRPCIEEMPSLVKLKEKYTDKLEILAVNVREDKQTIQKFTQSMRINFPLLQDFDSKITEEWKVFVYPSNYIVNTDGVLRFAATGALDWQDKDIEEHLESLFEK